MRPYMESLVLPEYLDLFRQIEKIMEKMPDLHLVDEEGRQAFVSCHMVCRALVRLFPGRVTWHDGFFVRDGQRHSWLRVVGDDNLIIDPYPVALLGGPIMVHGGWITTPWKRVYREARLTDLGGHAFRKQTGLVVRAMRSVQASP